ncbi:flagellar basal-body MS-ring/collar protein FliF [Desulfosediminicola flagellatus]|uniref:flagellar basal-body MS-ring/collar protein FliF n=1 Tax=Desulfosediminicola flagellatus TaxID=2569541 RepID=UPI0010AD9DF2|nr:flagellar basal-body MS-ring/collar protein FliF [Desulfosediminicola flagellatus]
MEAEQQIPADGIPDTTQKPVKKNVIQLVRDWPLSRKIATGAVILISIILFAILIIQARIADQQLLYANLSEKDAASVVSWLKAQRINYTLKNGGRNIWVPADKIYETRLDLAANGLPNGGSVGFEVFDNQSFALTDYVQKVNYTRALQGELARTITSLDPVESTRVHLALPEKRLFKAQQKKATASVIVTLLAGRTLDTEQVKGILHLVSGSITGLEPENVKVIDSNGMVLEAEESKKDQLLSVDMLAFQQEVEHRMEMRAQDLLDKTMGKNKAMVRVTAALDFSKVEKTEELYDAEEPVIRSEQIESQSSGTQTTGGIPGVQSNLQGNSGEAGSNIPPSNRNSRITNYEISKTISRIVNPIGTVTQLSVSVLVADKTETDEEGNVKNIPLTVDELNSIENMVSAALGLSTQRGDQINVLSMPFIDPPEGVLEQESLASKSLYQYLPFIKLGLVFVGALLLYFFLVRPVIKTMKGEVTEHYKTVEELEKEQKLEAQQGEEEIIEAPPTIEDEIVKIRRDVMQNQVPTAHIIKNWIHEG